ncbi:MAG TPA: hypothetical protein VLF16_13400, partial [Pseudomonas sp.]|nr:hypothetical protein [Pseudomonas sp.]
FDRNGIVPDEAERGRRAGENGERGNTMNGWQRLWMLCSILWTGVVLFYVAQTWQMRDRESLLNWNLLAEALLGLIVPILGSYLLGLLLARLRRSRRASGKHLP